MGAPHRDESVVDWLLDSDPAVRWQVMADVVDAPPELVSAERAKVASEGWGARLLARQRPDGSWLPDPANTSWTASPEGTAFETLLWLRDLGLNAASGAARIAVELVRDHVTWHWWDDNPFFVGEVEPCINGRVVALGAYFGEDVTRLVERLRGEQMADGGWNCEQENGATVGSFHTTINVLEGLLEYEQTFDGDAALIDARRRGEEYLLERRLLRRRSTGEVVDEAFTRLSFPTGYHYGVLRGLDYLRRAGVRDERAREAIELVSRKRLDDGRWPLERRHPEALDIGVGEAEGEPSRWITLRAARVLRWFEDRRR